jgi:hypothetical protein
MLTEIRAGYTVMADGTISPARCSRIGCLCTGDAHGKYYEQTSRGNVYSLMLTATSGNIAAGNLWAAAAGATYQFALWNPIGSGKNLALLKFQVWTVSGTAPVPPVIHAYASGVPTLATTVVTAIACNNIGLGAASVARALTSVAGTALTGATATFLLRAADLAVGAGTLTPANAFELKATEYIDGDIVIPPGTMWAPQWATAAATLWGASITWEEIVS